MRRIVHLSLPAVLALGACSEQPSAPRSTPSFSMVTAAPSGGGNLTGRHLVSFRGPVPAGFANQVAALGARVEWVSSGARLAVVSGLSGPATATLAQRSWIQSVVADQSFALDDPAVNPANVELADATESQANPAGAFFFARQWNMRAVQANLAWAAGFLGSADVDVFILDTGIDYLNLDLNGLVDQSRSVDLLGTFTIDTFSFTEKDTVAKYFPTRQPFTDLFFHGTHVGATVSSLAIGAAGVTSRTNLVAVKVCAYLNTCPFSSVLNGVIYAADHGADVVNMSLGGGFSKAGNGIFVGFINKAFNYARSKGVTIVVAAGNAAVDLDHNGNTYTTYCDTPAVICVAATGPTAQASVNGPWTNVDAPSYFTNFGRSAINVAAPGGNNVTFVWAACSRTSLLIPICRTGNFFVGAQGTSMSTPHVAGTAALLVPILGRNPAAIKARIQETADDLGAPGTDPFYGRGRLNVARAVGAIP